MAGWALGTKEKEFGERTENLGAVVRGVSGSRANEAMPHGCLSHFHAWPTHAKACGGRGGNDSEIRIRQERSSGSQVHCFQKIR